MSLEEPQVRRMLNDLGRALVDAISASPPVSDAVRRMRDEGYRLQLILDCKEENGDDSHGAQLELTARRPASPSREPAFRLDNQDVSFLRALGIDPTRPARRRR
ncbi:MAG: hypothetical protein AAGD38_00305 [Acidobacteriota bacterium]